MTPARRGAPAALCALALALAGCTVSPPPRATSAPRAPVLVVPPQIVEGADFRLSGSLRQGGLASGIVPAGATSLSLNGQPIPFATDRRFLVGFDRDAPAAVLLEARGGNMIHRRTLAIAPGAWRIESLPTLARGTSPSPEFLARRTRELEQIAAARAIISRTDGWRQRFRWPVTGRISGVFGSQRIYAGEPGAYHSGVDVARPEGTAIVAPADGVVILAAETPFSLEGRLLMIDHGMGLNSAFLHLSRIDVQPGQAVRQGQQIGAVGMTGRATGPHLHWSLRWRDARIDPQPVAGDMAR